MLSLVDFLTIPEAFVSIYLRQNWLGMVFFVAYCDIHSTKRTALQWTIKYSITLFSLPHSRIANSHHTKIDITFAIFLWGSFEHPLNLFVIKFLVFHLILNWHGTPVYLENKPFIFWPIEDPLIWQVDIDWNSSLSKSRNSYIWRVKLKVK